MKWKACAALGLSMVMAASVCLTPASALNYGEEWQGASSGYTSRYTDVPPTYWAYENIQRVSAKNWFNGYPDGSFHPLDSITRSEAMKVFVVFLGLELDEVTESSYYDVSENAWYAPYVEAGKGLLPTHVSIQGKTPFQPEMPVTREDAMYALVKALGYGDNEVKFADESVLNMFKDKSSLSSNVRPYIAFAVSAGLVSGRSDGTIGGQDPLSRAEFATILYRGSVHGPIDSYQPKLQSISIQPSTHQKLLVGEDFTISGTALYSDGSREDYDDLNPYNADNNDVVSINKNTITAREAGTCEIRFNNEKLKDVSIVVIVEQQSGVLSFRLNDYDRSTYDEYITFSGTVTDSANGTVSLTCNGQKIAVGEDGEFSQIMKLATGKNEFEFTAKNASGSSVSKSVIVQREEKKQGVVSFKMGDYDSITYEDTVLLSGVVTDSEKDKVTLTCNGSNVSLDSNGRFSHRVQLNIGKNEFEFVAKNTANNTVSRSVRIDREKAGVVSFQLDSYEDETYEESVTLSGTVTDSKNGKVTLTCNGKSVSVGSDGRFSYPVQLELGDNKFELVAKNESGSAVSKEVEIEREEKVEPLSLQLDAYPETTYSSSVSLHGVVTGGKQGKINLTCNGKTVTVDSNGRFSCQVSLQSGRNQFELIASSDGSDPVIQYVIIRCSYSGDSLYWQ